MDIIGKCSGIAGKYLAKVEVQPGASNQHEFNGIAQIRKFMGLQNKELACNFLYLDRDNRLNACEGHATWYEARDNHPDRSEFRLYFKENSVIRKAKAGNTLIVALGKNERLLLFALENETPWAQDIFSVFGLRNIPGNADSHLQTLYPPSEESKAIIERIIIESKLFD